MELVNMRRWVGWRYRLDRDKYQKKPRSAVTDIETGWPKSSVDFEKARAGAERQGMDGIGFNPESADGLVFIDFDDCLKNGALDAAVAKWLGALPGYTEVTPSGAGLRVVVRGKIPRNVTNRPLRDSQLGTASVELYAGGTAHFVTITGKRYNGSGFNITECQEAIDALLRAIGFDAREAQSEFESATEKASGETTEAAALRYFERTCAEAERLTEGRYGFLVRTCWWLGRILGSGPKDPRLTLANVQAQITEAIQRTGWTELRHIGGQLRAGMRRPLVLRTDAGDATSSPERESVGGSLNTAGANVDRFIRQHADNLRYLADLKKWASWDGRRWQITDASGAPTALAARTALSIYGEAAIIADKNARERRAKWAITSESRQHVESMVALARKGPPIRVEHYRQVFDRNKDLLTCTNGVVDLRSGALLAHEAAKPEMLTRLCPIAYNPTAECPEWERFIEWQFGDAQASLTFEETMPAYMQRTLGYFLTGHTRERSFFFLDGEEGQNGKTTMLETMKLLLNDAAVKVAFETFLESTFTRDAGNATPHLAAMVDARLVWAVEGKESGMLDADRMKEFSGEDTLTARGLHSGQVEYKPHFKIALIVNGMPAIRGDNAFYDRVHRVRFTKRIENPIKGYLEEKLTPELEGILAWCVRGAISWYANGLKPPLGVIEAKQELQIENSEIFEAWATAMLLFKPDDLEASLTLTALAKNFNEWAKRARGEKKPPGRRLLKQWLEIVRSIRCDERAPSGQRNVFRGVRWR
jgi:putative DNA primase/helicase